MPAAVRGQEAVYQVSILIRKKTFVEWGTIYYDPQNLSREELLKLVRTRCPRSVNVTVEDKDFTAVNPIVAGGELLQLQIADPKEALIAKLSLPEGWKIVGGPEGVVHEDKKTYLSIQVSKDADQKIYTIEITGNAKAVYKTNVEIVRRVH